MVLHAHLPYIRYPENEYHLEENWLYEAITETYIPLLGVFGGLLNDGVDFRITLSLTPTLIEMFNDGLLMRRYQRHLNNLIELSEKEIFRTKGHLTLEPLARMYHRKFSETKHFFENTYRKDLTSAFGSLMNSGKVEIITSSATHGYLPALMTEPMAVKAQIRLAADYFKARFGRNPGGMWLPECGYMPGFDTLLSEAGADFFFLESHGILNHKPQKSHGICSPVKTPSGAFAFVRDAESSREVWSAKTGYPGDPDYRDFYRDIGFYLDLEYIRPYLPAGTRTFTGIKYFSITGQSDNKTLYVHEKAMKKAETHAEHFLESREKQVLFLNKKLKTKPVITAAYDAELFGHWWSEGPEWLNFIFRKAAKKNRAFRFTTPSEYISENNHVETAVPCMSSWGRGGYSSTWINESNSWIYRHLHKAAKQMTESAARNLNARGLVKRALNQSARELLLAQSSDWAFMMKTDNTSGFARNKFREHIGNFLALQGELDSGSINETKLSMIEDKNCIFPDLSYKIYIRDQDMRRQNESYKFTAPTIL